MWNAILPLVGVVIGVLLQYLLSRSAEEKKQLALLRSQCYVDYLRASARVAHAESRDGAREDKADIAHAKARIAVYGSQAVVAVLARFEKRGPVLDNPQSLEHFVELAAAMRGSRVRNGDLELVLFGVPREALASAPKGTETGSLRASARQRS